MNHHLTRAWVVGSDSHPLQIGLKRWHLLRDAFQEAVKLRGDVAECGVLNGDTTVHLLQYLEVMGIKKTVHLFDTFTGFPSNALRPEDNGIRGAPDHGDWKSEGLEVLKTRLHRPEWIYEARPGPFSDTLPPFSKSLCFIFADADLYESTSLIIAMADRCLVPGGYIVFDAYVNVRYPGVEKAVDDHLDMRYKRVARGGSEWAKLLVARKRRER